RFERIVRLIEDILEAGDAWVTTVEAISRHIRALTDAGEYHPRVDHVPYLTSPVAEGLAAVGGLTADSEDSRCPSPHRRSTQRQSYHLDRFPMGSGSTTRPEGWLMYCSAAPMTSGGRRSAPLPPERSPTWNGSATASTSS